MGQSYRIRTELGVNKTINIELNQDFEFLEILSLKIQQTDIYTRSCADYGVLVGRITANNGFGLPNARVSIFIPVTSVDESNPIISSIYPYKSPTDKNEDGYRYNLLPYEKSYSKHAATGTLPSRGDVLTGATAVEIYDKYYKFTAKTNESGDYMIMGVPLGDQTVVMDVDLSDIGEFSLTPQDLIRMGLATEAQVAGNQFRTSNDLSSLPQLVSLTKTLEVSPLWGDPDICQIAINRLDFDLRDEANIDIQPTAVFMGSIFSSPDNFRIRKNCRPRDNMGNLCGLTAGPGQILAIRQTIAQDVDGNPVLEEHQLEQAGNVIDGDGTWLIELPMNLEYYITNEFGEKVVSYDPSIGIPTKAKYRFKIKWQQPNDLTLQTRRAYYLIPNVKEYGWSSPTSDPTGDGTSVERQQQQSSYYFGLAWSGYTQGFNNSTQKNNRLNEVINCEDTFYEFKFNRVYTVSTLIDEYKKGAKGRFIGIKEIDDESCESTINKFPVNDGFRNFDFLFFLFSILMTIIQPVALILLTIAHILIWLYNLFLGFLCWLSGIGIGRPINWYPFRRWSKYCDQKDYTIRLPMITYPDCQACDCKQDLKTGPNKLFNAGGGGVLTQLSNSLNYFDGYQTSAKFSADTENGADWSAMFSEASAGIGLAKYVSDPIYKTPVSQMIVLNSDFNGRIVTSNDLPIGERINLFNQRKNYFMGGNKIKVSFAPNLNIGKYHYDNTITILSQQQFNSGDLLTFVNTTGSTDVNYNYSAITANGVVTGISGTSYNGKGVTNVSVTYADPGDPNGTTSKNISYTLPYGSFETNYKFPADIEYFQVVTAITISDASKIWKSATTQSFGNVVSSPTTLNSWKLLGTFWGKEEINEIVVTDYFEGYSDQYILILQRGIDPYSPIYQTEYSLGTLFGTNDDDPNWKFTADTRINIPIQPITLGSNKIQGYSQSEMFYQSYFFKPGIKFNTTSTSTYTLGEIGSLAIGLGLSYVEGQIVVIKSSVDKTKEQVVIVKTYNINTGILTFDNVTVLNGLGETYSSWIVSLLDGNVESTNGGKFTGYTTINTAYYGLLDSTVANLPTNTTITNGSVVSLSSNGFYSSNISSTNYDGSEDLSGMGVMSVGNFNNNNSFVGRDYLIPTKYSYYTKSIFATNPNLTIDNSSLNVLRTDRLPTSDGLDGAAFTLNPAILQQNNNFSIYLINTFQEDISSQAYQTGANIVTADLQGLPNYTTVLSSFDCENMVGLKCYTGFGSSFEINQNCVTSDAVERGCYMFMREPLTDLKKDWDNFSEWSFRFRFFYGLCRGVLSQSFMNNWINGTLYAFPIQVDTKYNSQNKVSEQLYCGDVIFFDDKSNNFYYRSSPYNVNTNKFVGKQTNNPNSVNKLNLLYPTTIVNLGMKDSFYSEITFEPDTKAYILPSINSTSYGDTSDLINLFVISRITDEGFLRKIISFGDNSLDQLFSRDQKRIDGDLAQLLSINSEIGNVNFSPEFYEIIPNSTNNPTNILGSANDPIIAVWFSSSTEDLQTKDYLTPGRIDFRGENNVGFYPYPYGIKSQVVPFYQWQLNNTNSIFGNQMNTWATNSGDIVQNTRYQSLDRSSLNTKYFLNDVSASNDLNARGYIFSVDNNGNYSTTGALNNKFVVGAPFQFYFGIIKGASALDKFKTKYSISE